MKLLLLAAGLLCQANAWGARTAFQQRCEDTIGNTVALLTARQNGHTLDNTLSVRTLTRMKGGAGGSAVLGITRTEARIAIGLKGPILDDPASGHECMAPRITVALSYVPVVIYVGREFAPGSCAYQEIVSHEMRHLKTYFDHLPKVESSVRAALSRRFEARPLYAPSGQALALLKNEIDRGWMPYIRTEMGKVELLQSAIDTPQEYARLGKVCKGEVQSLIGPARPTNRSTGRPSQ